MNFNDNPHKDELLSIPFDQFQRYRKTAELIAQIKEQKNIEKISVLDVGASNEGHLKKFLHEDKITFLDQTYPDNLTKDERYIVGDATRLPFNSQSFDIVTSVDVYEHIRPQKREKYISELYRVGKYGCILGAPFNTRDVSLFEELSNEFYKIIHNENHIWLKEHIEFGLPSFEDTLKITKKSANNVYTFPNGYLPRWIKLIQLIFAADHELTTESLKLINRFYNENFYFEDNKEPCYRHFLVLLKEACDLTETSKASQHVSLELKEKSLDHMISNLMAAFQMRLKYDYHKLQQEHSQLQQEHSQLQQERTQLQQEHAQLQQEHAQLQQEYNVIQQSTALRIARKLGEYPLIKKLLLMISGILTRIFR